MPPLNPFVDGRGGGLEAKGPHTATVGTHYPKYDQTRESIPTTLSLPEGAGRVGGGSASIPAKISVTPHKELPQRAI